jgi:glycosyltransferase involved in cell wall biosynthesis
VRVPEIPLPEGQYFSLSGAITTGAGGQTRALLVRNRLLAERSGIEPTLLTFDERPFYPRTREELRRIGQLVDPMRLLNIYEWYRDTDIDHLPATGETLPELDGFDTVEDLHPDGTVYRTRYRHSHRGDDVVYDYRRADGTVFLRISADVPPDKKPPFPTYLVNTSGQIVASWPHEHGWRQDWLRSLVEPGRRAFVISDSRYAVPYIVPMDDENIHVMHVVHNLHLMTGQRWNADVKPSYRALFARIGDLDGLVTLTRRQQEDIAALHGARSNLYVVPNPVEPPVRPDPLPPRERMRFATLARFEWQKRLEDAVRAFAVVLKEEPDAVLDIFGDGRGRSALEAEIASLGVQDSVFLRGHDPQARDALWSATALLLPSRFEGYPMATLESLARGCPVISYDVKYGPREQISHGVDGFLVEPGDTQGMADRIVELIRKPELVASMSEAAYVKAGQHGHDTFLEDWRTVLEGVVAAKERRTTLESVTLKVTRLGWVRRRQLPSRFAGYPVIGRFARTQSASAAFSEPRSLRFAGRLIVEGTSPRATLDSAVVTLEAINGSTGSIVAIPLDVRRSDSTFDLAATIDAADVFRQLEDTARSVELRLRLVWENSSWETVVTRPRRMEPNYEVSFSGKGELSLHRGKAAPR